MSMTLIHHRALGLALFSLTLAACQGTIGDVLSPTGGGDMVAIDARSNDALPGDAAPLDAPSILDATAAPDAMPPMVLIYHPADNETRTASTPIPFVGHASDPQDGALVGAALAWSSSIDGAIGSGESFSASLTHGVHRITLTATDSLGLRGTASITLNVN